jgi:chromosome segregation ATPase
MLKRIVIGGASLALAGGLLLGGEAWSYLRTFGSQMREAVKQEISVEFELQRIRDEVESLMPEIRRHMRTVAEQSVDVKDLERALVERRKGVEEQRLAILTLRQDLESGRGEYVYRSVSYSRREVEADLANRFEAYQSAEKSVERDQRILEAQRETLRANQQRLDGMQSRRQDLSVQVAQLEARLKQVQAAESLQSSPLDDSRLANVERLIGEMNRTLDVREALLESEGRISGRIPVESGEEPGTDILTRIDNHFSAEGKDEAGADSSMNDSRLAEGTGI